MSEQRKLDIRRRNIIGLAIFSIATIATLFGMLIGGCKC